eukprot:m51a1_g7044 hypothetical protein (362) ;mRNA; r:124404-125780
MSDDESFTGHAPQLYDRVNVDELLQHPLFATSVPDEMTPEFEALQMIAYEGTPTEIAENFRNQGNENFRRGKQWWDDALKFYGKALAAKAPEASLNSVIYLNMAAVELSKGNYGRALGDCKMSIKLTPPGTVKAHWRAARCCLELGRLEEAEQFCKWGLQVEAGNSEILKIQAHVAEALAARAAAEERRRREWEERERASKETAVRAELESRKIRLGDPTLNPADLSAMLGDARAYVDEESDQLVFPVALVFPEYNSVDAVAAWGEGVPVGAQLNAVLEERRPWDERGDYVGSAGVDVYVTLGGRRGVDAGARIAKLKATSTLSSVLGHRDYVMPNTLIPELFVVSRSSPFLPHFLKGEHQ